MIKDKISIKMTGDEAVFTVVLIERYMRNINIEHDKLMLMISPIKRIYRKLINDPFKGKVTLTLDVSDAMALYTLLNTLDIEQYALILMQAQELETFITQHAWSMGMINERI